MSPTNEPQQIIIGQNRNAMPEQKPSENQNGVEQNNIHNIPNPNQPKPGLKRKWLIGIGGLIILGVVGLLVVKQFNKNNIKDLEDNVLIECCEDGITDGKCVICGDDFFDNNSNQPIDTTENDQGNDNNSASDTNNNTNNTAGLSGNCPEHIFVYPGSEVVEMECPNYVPDFFGTPDDHQLELKISGTSDEINKIGDYYESKLLSMGWQRRLAWDEKNVFDFEGNVTHEDRNYIKGNLRIRVNITESMYEDDKLEIHVFCEDYSQYSDADADGISDDEENFWGTDQNNPDTDGDGYLDGEEVENGYDPNGEGKLY